MSSETSRPRRYAIYFVPAAETPLYRFGAALLGYDAYQGTSLTSPETVTCAVADWCAVSEEPRKYGFHATLKAPIALADCASEVGLIAACEEFSATPRVIPTFSPVVRAISDFIALVPERQPSALSDLAQDCVTAFDRFRAPLTEADRARRNPAVLSPRQRDHLERWGYPYVGEDFRFHMTLTGRLDAGRRGHILALLREAFAQTGIAAVGVDRIALCRQAEPGARFRVLRSFPLVAI